jgi:hypothetical protein
VLSEARDLVSQAAADVTAPLVRGFARWGMFEWECSLSALRPLVQ